MTVMSRKELAFTILVYGALLSRTQAQTFCSCWNDFRSDYFNRPYDVLIDSNQCATCSNQVHLALLTDRCDSQHRESLRLEHQSCTPPVRPQTYVRYYQCSSRKGVYTCSVPRAIYRDGVAALPYYSSLLLKYRPSDSGVNPTSTPVLLYNNVATPTISLGNGCAKMAVCIDPPRVFQNTSDGITLTAELTGSDVVIVTDVIASVFYIQTDNTNVNQARVLTPVQLHQMMSGRRHVVNRLL